MKTRIKLKKTHKFDFLSGYQYSTITYKGKEKFTVLDDNIRVVYKDEKMVQYSLFTILSNILKLDWFDDIVEYLDKYYYLYYSGEKFISKYFENLIYLYDYDNVYHDNYIFLSKKVYEEISNTLSMLFKSKWSKIFNSFNINYDLFKNYDETITINESFNESNEYSDNKIINDSNTTNKSNDNFIYGFNSDAQVSESSDSSNNFEQITGSHTNRGSYEKNRNFDDNKKVIDKGGFNSKKTKQQIILEELSLREINLINIICDDIDYLLTTKIF